jgi:hypothetical protein
MHYINTQTTQTIQKYKINLFIKILKEHKQINKKLIKYLNLFNLMSNLFNSHNSHNVRVPSSSENLTRRDEEDYAHCCASILLAKSGGADYVGLFLDGTISRLLQSRLGVNCIAYIDNKYGDGARETMCTWLPEARWEALRNNYFKSHIDVENVENVENVIPTFAPKTSLDFTE